MRGRRWTARHLRPPLNFGKTKIKKINIFYFFLWQYPESSVWHHQYFSLKVQNCSAVPKSIISLWQWLKVTPPPPFKKSIYGDHSLMRGILLLLYSSQTPALLMETGNLYLCDWTHNYTTPESVQPWSFLILALDEGD
jgi:hypothetical protein